MYDILKGLCAVLIAVIFLWFGYLFIGGISSDIGRIDIRVETIDGRVYRCSDVYSSRGMTYMNSVNGGNIRLVIPSGSIKTITELN